VARARASSGPVAPATASGGVPSQETSPCDPRRTRNGSKPTNENRPHRSPCSADSSRKLGPSPASFAYTDSGVSRSASSSRQTGTTPWSRRAAGTRRGTGGWSRARAPVGRGCGGGGGGRRAAAGRPGRHRRARRAGAGGSSSAGRCGRRPRHPRVRPAAAACRRRSRPAGRRPAGCCPRSRPCATARPGSGCRTPPRRARVSGRAPPRPSRPASARHRGDGPGRWPDEAALVELDGRELGRGEQRILPTAHVAATGGRPSLPSALPALGPIRSTSRALSLPRSDRPGGRTEDAS
jgi:hypothetical protein